MAEYIKTPSREQIVALKDEERRRFTATKISCQAEFSSRADKSTTIAYELSATLASSPAAPGAADGSLFNL